MKRVLGFVVLAVAAVAVAYVVAEAVRTLRTLSAVERERDTWQRPDDVLRQLDLGAGDSVIDFGSGAGYFALRLAPRVGPDGRVFAVDLRRESLAFLWIRAVIGGHRHLQVVHNDVDDAKLPPGPVDAVLVANTYHELAAPVPILKALFATMRSGARLVVVDRGPRPDGDPDHPVVAADHHGVTAADAERVIIGQGFEVVSRDARFIDRPGDDDLWWMIVFRKP